MLHGKMKKSISLILSLSLLWSLLPGFSLTANAESLGTLVGAITLGNNDTKEVTGTFTFSPGGGDKRIKVTGSNAKLVLNGINADVTGTNATGASYDFDFIDASSASGKLTIELKGDNVIHASQNHAAMRCGANEVEFVGNGKLTVYGGGTAPAIGGNGMNVVLNMDGGTVEAIGGTASAGIGAGIANAFNDFSSIKVLSGTVIATGGNGDGNTYIGGAGIGMGASTNASSKTGDITISGGTVTATGTDGGAGIGGGFGNDSVNDRNLTGSVTINGGKVTATGACGGAGIGGSRGHAYTEGYTEGGSGWYVQISGGDVKAYGSGTDKQGSAGIGGGCGSGYSWPGETGTISISGGNVEATGGIATSNSSIGGAGIGSGGYADESGKGRPCNSNITISGNPTVNAYGKGNAAGIGGGSSRFNGPITIYGGTVTATGGDAKGPGIGSATSETRVKPQTLEGGTHSTEININGGDVTAIGGKQNGSATFGSTTKLIGGTFYAKGMGTGGVEGTTVVYGGTFYAEGGDSAEYTVQGTYRQFGGKSIIWNDYGAAARSAKIHDGVAYITSASGQTGGISITAEPSFTSGTPIVYLYGTDFVQYPKSDIGLVFTTQTRPNDPSNPQSTDYQNASAQLIGVNKQLTIPDGSTINIAAGQTLTLPNGAFMENRGTMSVDGTFEVKGTFQNYGTITNAGTINNYRSFTNTGTITNNGNFVNQSGSVYSGNTPGGNYTAPPVSTELVNLEVGKTYYFSLTDKMNEWVAVTDRTIIQKRKGFKYDFVPFVYAGKINSYNFNSYNDAINAANRYKGSPVETMTDELAKKAAEQATEQGTDRVLFVAKTYVGKATLLSEARYSNGYDFMDGAYKLRSPSGGYKLYNLSDKNNWSKYGEPVISPTNNEFDQLKDHIVYNDLVLTSDYAWTYRYDRSMFGNSVLLDYNDTYAVFRYKSGGYYAPSSYVWFFTVSWLPVLEVNPNRDANQYYPVTLHLNGKTVETADENNEKIEEIPMVFYGNSFKAPEKETITTDEGILVWNTAADGTGRSYKPGESVPTTVGDLYAIWYSPITITTDKLPSTAYKSGEYSGKIEVSNSTGVTFTEIGENLPQGLTLNSDGTISGEAEEVGTFAIKVRAESQYFPAEKTVYLTVEQQKLYVNRVEAANGWENSGDTTKIRIIFDENKFTEMYPGADLKTALKDFTAADFLVSGATTRTDTTSAELESGDTIVVTGLATDQNGTAAVKLVNSKNYMYLDSNDNAYQAEISVYSRKYVDVEECHQVGGESDKTNSGGIYIKLAESVDWTGAAATVVGAGNGGFPYTKEQQDNNTLILQNIEKEGKVTVTLSGTNWRTKPFEVTVYKAIDVPPEAANNGGWYIKKVVAYDDTGKEYPDDQIPKSGKIRFFLSTTALENFYCKIYGMGLYGEGSVTVSNGTNYGEFTYNDRDYNTEYTINVNFDYTEETGNRTQARLTKTVKTGYNPSISFSSVYQSGGSEGAKDSTGIVISFRGEPVEFTMDDIISVEGAASLTGDTKLTKTDYSENNQHYLLEPIKVNYQGDVMVKINNKVFSNQTITGGEKTGKIYKQSEYLPVVDQIHIARKSETEARIQFRRSLNGKVYYQLDGIKPTAESIKESGTYWDEEGSSARSRTPFSCKTINGLEEGEHTLYIVPFDSIGRAGDMVTVKIPAKAPEYPLNLSGDSSSPFVGFDGKKWCIIGEENQGIGFGENTATLCLPKDSGNYGSTKFNDNENVDDKSKLSIYKGSLLEKAMENAYQNLIKLKKEKALVKEITLEGDKGNTVYYKDNKEAYTGSKVRGGDVSAHFWLMSAAEASFVPTSNLMKNFSEDQYSWLPHGMFRTPSADDRMDGSERSDIHCESSFQYDIVSYEINIQPTFVMDTSNVYFLKNAANTADTTAEETDESTQTDGLAVYSKPDGDFKFLMKNADIKADITLSKTTAAQGEPLDVSYSGATAGDNMHLSAILKDKNGNIKYYGSFANIAEESGTAKLVMPSDIENGTYTAELFAEEQNGNYYTDFAGAISSYTITVDSTATAPTVELVMSDQANAPATGYFTLSFNRSMNTEKGTVTLNGEKLTTQWQNSSTCYVSYSDLDGGAEYTVKLSGFEDFSGKELTAADLSFKTAKLTLSADKFTFEAPTELVYDGNEKTASVTTADESIGEITLKYYSGDTQLNELPRNVGTYTVKIDAAESEKYLAATDLTGSSWTFEITKATPTNPATPEIEAFQYRDGISLSDIRLPYGWAWEENPAELTVGLNKRKVIYKVSDTENYDWSSIVGYNANTKQVERTAQITVTPAAPTEYKIKSITTSGNEVTVSFDSIGEAVLIIASYSDDGSLIEAQYADITDTETEKKLTLNTSGAKKVSAFIWSDFENLTPYADSHSEPIKAVSK